MVEEIKKNNSKTNFDLNNPIFFGFIIAGVFISLLLTAAILKTFLDIDISYIISSIIHLSSIIILGIIYNQIYNEKLSKDLISKTALYSSLFILIFFVIIGLTLFTIKQFIVGRFIFLIGAGISLINFVITYFNLNLSNGVTVNNILGNFELPQNLTCTIQPNEEIIAKPQRITFKSSLFTLFIYIFLIAFWVGMGNEIFERLGILSIVITIGVFTFAIIDTIDMLIFSRFILTNQRIIKRRYFLYSEITFNEILSLTSSQIFDFGSLLIINKNGCSFKSPMIANPNNVKEKIESYIKSFNHSKE